MIIIKQQVEKKEHNENYEECAICEAKEEADVNIDELVFVILSKGFRIFLGEDKEVLYKTAIYLQILEIRFQKG